MENLKNLVEKAREYLDSSEFSSAIKVIDEGLDAELKLEFGDIIKGH